MTNKPEILAIVKHHTLTQGPEGEKLFIQLFLDPTACPVVIKACKC